MLSDPTLSRWTRQFNRRWFNGDLPVANIICHWEPVEGCDADCMKIYEGVTDRETDDFMIRIDPVFRTAEKVAKMALIHELVHIELWPYVGHGDRFQRRMMQLAVGGAFRQLW